MIPTSAGRASRPRSSASRRAAGTCSCYTTLPMISGDQGPRRRLAGAGRVRPFRRRAGRARRRSSRALRISLELVKSGKAYVKISGAYRASKLAPDYPDAAPLAQALIAANADRIVWGTDWPHPDSVTPPGKKVDRRHAAVPDRRRPAAQPACRSGRRMRRSARRSWSTIRRGSTGFSTGRHRARREK